MTLIKHPIAFHNVTTNEAQILDAKDHWLVPGKVDEIASRHDGLHARERQGLVKIDRLDAGVRMRAAQDPAIKHAGLREVRAEGGPPCHLLEAIGPDGALANPLVVRRTVCRHGCASIFCASIRLPYARPSACASFASSLRGGRLRPRLNSGAHARTGLTHRANQGLS